MNLLQLHWCWLWLLCLFAISRADDNSTQPISIFRSVSCPYASNLRRRLGFGIRADNGQRPDLVAPVLTIFIQTREKQAPGFYFAAPYQQKQESIHIYDNDAVYCSSP
jgi:hypothetical protein